MKSLNYEYIEQTNFASDSDIEIAAIGGNKNNLLLGKLIGDENDGLRLNLFIPRINRFYHITIWTQRNPLSIGNSEMDR